jgi:PIN domain nuclease of toxin-antitoxin system
LPITPKARQFIDGPDNEIFISAATIWEIAIKHKLTRSGPYHTNRQKSSFCRK